MRNIGKFGLSVALAALALTPLGGNEPQKRLTVRVDSRSGAPCLVVNGKPVRARMFMGGPTSGGSIQVESAATQFSFEFEAQDDAQRCGTIHFRFGDTPGDLFLDNIRIVEVASGAEVMSPAKFSGGQEEFTRDWAYWPPTPQNTVGSVSIEPKVGANGTGGLHVRLKAPPGGNWPDFHIYHQANLTFVRGRRYRVAFWMRADPARDVMVRLYRPGAPFTYLGGPPGAFEMQIRLAAAAGVNFVSIPIASPWPAPGENVDWWPVDAACEEVLRANPKALLLPRFGVDPPEWWKKAHPDDMMAWEDGSRGHTAVVASPLYRREAAERVGALVAHLEAKFGDHVAGYHPVGQNTGEWFYQNTWESLLNGYAPADRAAWRAWLRERYRNDASLQASWHDPSASIDSVEVPTPKKRRASPSGILHDPVTERDLIDFADFQQQAMADLVCDLAHAVRLASHGRKLVTFFYGYVFEFGPIQLGPATCGHYALRRILDCPDIDLLCSPISYFDRGIGGSAPTMTAAESVALAGKMWLCEDDTRTHLGTGSFPGEFDGAKTPWETYSMLVRNVAEEATRNFATWWMDLGRTGWFNDPKMWAEMRRLENTDRPFIERSIPFRPEVAAVIDERSMLGVAREGWRVTDPGIYKVRKPLGRMGAPYGQYLLDDVSRGRVKARVFVFLNAWRLTAAQRAAILVHTQGAGRVWCYAPGRFDGDRASLGAMQELTGFRLVPVTPEKSWAVPTDAGKRLGLRSGFGVQESVRPLFAAADATRAETLATYPDGSAAVALRKVHNGWSLFVGAPGLTSELLRVIARKSGVHLYTQEDCNVYANGPIIALHASQGGTVVLDTGRVGQVTDAMTGKRVGSGPHISLPMKLGETRVLRH